MHGTCGDSNSSCPNRWLSLSKPHAVPRDFNPSTGSGQPGSTTGDTESRELRQTLLSVSELVSVDGHRAMEPFNGLLGATGGQ